MRSETIPWAERADIDARERYQARRLARLLRVTSRCNPFYAAKYEGLDVDAAAARGLVCLEQLPFTTKAELVADQQFAPPWGSARSRKLARFTRYSQTSSTTGKPLRWLDTDQSWRWMVGCWKAVYRAAGVTRADRILVPFSFGPFAGFWLCFEAGCQVGALCVPGGGMTSEQRLTTMETLGITAICCTPTYALRLMEVSNESGIARDYIRRGSVRVLIVGGEPGGNVPATRARIQEAWQARIVDHYGLTEVGPVAFECTESPGGMHVNEAEYIAEVVDPAGRPAADGQPGELVLTNLGRTAAPIIRYRTGDVVRRRRGVCACGRSMARLEGGIVGRIDDMITIRGVNVFPSSIESVVRKFSQVVEFRSTVRSAGAMRSLSLEVEVNGAAPAADLERSLSQDLRNALGLSIPVHVVERGSLPRFELKARRCVRVQASLDATAASGASYAIGVDHP